MTDAPPPAYAGPTRVLSGVQPTGALHLGNYLGALVKFTRLQHEMETFIFVADLHAITQWQDPKRLKDQVPPCRPTPSSPGCSTASPASAGSTA